MTDPFRTTRKARQDLVELFRFITRKAGLRSARRFLATVESTFERLTTVTNLGTPFMPGEPRFAGFRYCPVGR